MRSLFESGCWKYNLIISLINIFLNIYEICFYSNTSSIKISLNYVPLKFDSHINQLLDVKKQLLVLANFEDKRGKFWIISHNMNIFISLFIFKNFSYSYLKKKKEDNKKRSESMKFFN